MLIRGKKAWKRGPGLRSCPKGDPGQGMVSGCNSGDGLKLRSDLANCFLGGPERTVSDTDRGRKRAGGRRTEGVVGGVGTEEIAQA